VGGSLFLFRIWGIAVRMHVTFPLILIWGALQFGWFAGQGTRGAVFGVVVTLLLFVIVVLHELGHSYAALRYQIPVRQIVLLPIGGVAQLERMPENPRQELVIALAGPAVNFALAALLYPLGRAFGYEPANLGVLRAMAQGGGEALFAYVFLSNLFLGIFNLLPAFPMDGGRVLRAGLATQMEYARATRIAVTVGQAMAWLIGLWGFLGGGLFTILLAVFIYIGAGQEGQLVQVRSVLRNLRVRQALSREAQTLDPEESLQRAVDLTLSSFQADFPVVQDGRLVGLLQSGDLMRALANGRVDAPVREVMRAEPPSAGPDDDLFEVQQKIAETRVDALPIVQDGRFVGLLTSRDLNEIYGLLSVSPDLRGRLTPK
jgi:Zn-dependent protease/CBS domain-containing protein